MSSENDWAVPHLFVVLSTQIVTAVVANYIYYHAQKIECIPN